MTGGLAKMSPTVCMCDTHVLYLLDRFTNIPPSGSVHLQSSFLLRFLFLSLIPLFPLFLFLIYLLLIHLYILLFSGVWPEIHFFLPPYYLPRSFFPCFPLERPLTLLATFI